MRGSLTARASSRLLRLASPRVKTPIPRHGIRPLPRLGCVMGRAWPKARASRSRRRRSLSSPPGATTRSWRVATLRAAWGATELHIGLHTPCPGVAREDPRRARYRMMRRAHPLLLVYMQKEIPVKSSQEINLLPGSIIQSNFHLPQPAVSKHLLCSTYHSKSTTLQ